MHPNQRNRIMNTGVTDGLPPIGGYANTCPCCGRGQSPRCTHTRGTTRYFTCALCPGRMRVDYINGVPQKPKKVAQIPPEA